MLPFRPPPVASVKIWTKKTWLHVICVTDGTTSGVHVGDSVADRSWSCPGCNKELLASSTPVVRPAKTISSRRSAVTVSSTASARAARAALELQQLEERKRMELRRVLEDEECRKQEAELEKTRVEQEKLQREKEMEHERRRLEEGRRQQEQEKLQREKEAELERKKLENERRQQQQEQALTKKKLDDDRSRSELLRKLEEKYLAEKYRILNTQLGSSISKGSSISSISIDRMSDGAKALPETKSQREKQIWDVHREQKDAAKEIQEQDVECHERERLNRMRQEEEKRREESRKKLEQMGFAEKYKTLYAPRKQRVIEWAKDFEFEESAHAGVLSVPLPMRNSGTEGYTGTKPKASRKVNQRQDTVSVVTAALAAADRVEASNIQDDGPGSNTHRPLRQSNLLRDIQIKPPYLPMVPEDNHPGPNPGSNALMQGSRQGQFCPTQPNPRASGLTNSQLAARQVLPKDLPSFSGNSEDWPVFISNYENSTSECGYSNAENLIRLQRCLKGDALEAVRSRLLLPASVPRVIDTLRMLFGRPEILINSLLNKIRNTPSPREGRLDTLIAYGMAVQSYCDHLVAANLEAHLANPSLLHDLVEKLPSEIKLKWVDFKDAVPLISLDTFGKFMSEMVRKASEVTTYRPAASAKASKDEVKKSGNSKTRGFVNHHSDPRASGDDHYKQTPSEKVCPVCSKPGHGVDSCGKFKTLNPDERWKAVRMHNLCRSCLRNHIPFPCRRPKDCSVDGCRLRHHPLLHSSPSQSKIAASPQNYHTVSQTVIYRILPVTVYGASGSVNTFALLDEASEVTMIERSLANELGLKGSPDPLHLRWTGNVSRVEEQSCVVKLEISGKREKRRFSVVNARTVEELELPVQSINSGELINSFPYLKGLPIDGYDEARPQLLIGLENLYLSTPLKIREGPRGQPIATKTRLGWCVYGGLATKPDEFRGVFHVSRPNEDHQLHDLVKQYFLTDSLGVTPLTSELESVEEKKARQILETTTRRVPGGFETGLLWRCDEVHFPNSYPMALSRLKCMERKIQKVPELAQRVHDQVYAYLEKGYARIATEEDLCSDDQARLWFLPLGVVINPKKPQKLRLIWDAAAQVKGTSFNSMMLKGPDLLTPLTSVQYRFRQRRVAVTGDIREMYHQFKIVKRDQKSQMFLYRRDPTEEPVIFVMNVGIFGAACSPCSAQYIKNLNAREYEQEFPKAAEAIINGHYVDDFLDSRDTVEEVIRLAEEVRYVHSLGGFEIRNFMSNCWEVLEGLGEQDAASEKMWSSEESNVAESVLGIRWLPQTDELTFSAYMPDMEEGLLDGSVRPTKRQILRMVMSLYDPLGFLATYVIQGKIIIQDLWRTNCGWDDPIDDATFGDWNRWIHLLPMLNDVRVPRAYFGNAVPENCQPLQLHTFVDGSSTAYSCVVYIRFIYAGQPHCALVGAKAKVAPIKTLSIPRLELQAAILGTRLAQFILENHQLPIHQRFYWTDSSTVLHWINSDSRRYRPYVACRIGEILTSTSPNEWKKVPTMQNVADKATKWGNGPRFDPEDPWFRGPQFLWRSEKFWPEQNWRGTDAAEELRPVLVTRRVKIEPVIDVKRFSKWEKLRRTIAYVLKFGGVKSEDGSLQTPISAELLRRAEVKLWKMVQAETFPEEIAELQSKHSTKPSGAVSVSSPLYKLSAFIDEEGLVRMDGRIGAAPNVPIEAKYPVILAQNHSVTFLFVDFYHRRCHHRNQETVVNELRQLVYIPGLRNLVRKVVARCQVCKVYNASPASPKMGPLPRARLEAYLRPFTYTGVDYFGPVLIKVGRSHVKRWVALFTCLTTRAIHMEVAHSLSTTSCKMCIRRFISRRGAPAEIYSDNGTNFRGAANELRDQIQNIHQHCAETFTNTTTKWYFNPPAAPHMGGVWERLVRSVKVALESMASTPRVPDDETFETIILEAESMINSRPLTYVTLESASQEALTPNHFLLGSSNGVKQPPKEPTEAVACLRSSWNLAQHILDGFWKRWLHEYLPTIARRTKWFRDTKPIEVGDLVFVVNESKRNTWIRGQVVEVIRGRDGVTRQAMVRTEAGIIRRPAVKLAVIEVAENGKVEASGENQTQPYGPGNVGTATIHPQSP